MLKEGVKAGRYYKAWYYVIQNPQYFATIFKNHKPFLVYYQADFVYFKSRKLSEAMAEKFKELLESIDQLDKSPGHKSSSQQPTKNLFINFFKDQIKEDFLIKLKEKFNTEKGKNIKLLIEALKELDLVSIDSRGSKKFYDSMKAYFNRDIGSYQSINDFKKAKDEAYNDDYKLMIDKITSIKNELSKQ